MDKSPFPAWLRELCYFGGLIVTLTIFALNLKSDQRSSREELARVSSDVAAIRANLPNKEADEEKMRAVRKEIADNHEWVKFEIAKLVKFREETAVDLVLLKKGVRE